MKSKLSLILLAFCILLSLAACQGGGEPSPNPEEPQQEVSGPEDTGPDAVEPTEPTEPTEPEEEPEAPALDPSLSQRDRDWIEDIEYLREEYKATHMDPFYLCSEAEFDFKLDQLKLKVSQLSDEDMYFEIAAIMASVGDVHTFAVTPGSLYDRQFPIGAQYFGDRLYLCAYQEGYEQFAPYLLHEIVAVNGIDIAYLEKKMETLYNPFNHWLGKEYFKSSFLPAFFDWAGCDYQEGYTFDFLNDNLEVESVEVPVITMEDLTAAWVTPEYWGQLPFRKPGNHAEYVEGENGGLVYLSIFDLHSDMNGDKEFMAPFDLSIELIKEHPECGKLVIDLRNLPGGEQMMIAKVREYVRELRTSGLPIEHTYVLTGGYSASAAITCLDSFKNDFGAVIVGEPTGQFTSFFISELEPTILPHSEIAVRISSHWYTAGFIGQTYYDENDRLYPWEYTVLPDVYVHQDIEDIRQGKDSVLEWVLAQ